jgi:hypothetical protein
MLATLAGDQAVNMGMVVRNFAKSGAGRLSADADRLARGRAGGMDSGMVQGHIKSFLTRNLQKSKIENLRQTIAFFVNFCRTCH